jgi:hydroxysqualene synthase
VSLAAAYRACEDLARAHYENFPVASRLLPRRMRPHVAAVYAFARTADDFADEGRAAGGSPLTPAGRHALLDDWLRRLRETAADPSKPGPRSHLETRDPGPETLYIEALGHTIRACDLPVELFEDLISAFRQDITTHRYATWDDLLDYCRRSANPVGRLVLRIAGYRDPALDRASDALCTALQLVNFWQDLAIDWQRGRLYVPEMDRVACGADEADLGARRLTEEWRAALERVAARTRELFEGGRPVCDGVRGRLRLELRMTWLGGVTILDRLRARGFDVFAARPTLGRADLMRLAWQALWWRKGGRVPLSTNSPARGDRPLF